MNKDTNKSPGFLASIIIGVGQLVGEGAHQGNKLCTSVEEGANDLVDIVKNSPELFKQGYDEEIFEESKESLQARLEKMAVFGDEGLRAYAAEAKIELGILKRKADLIAAIVKG